MAISFITAAVHRLDERVAETLLLRRGDRRVAVALRCWAAVLSRIDPAGAHDSWCRRWERVSCSVEYYGWQALRDMPREEARAGLALHELLAERQMIVIWTLEHFAPSLRVDAADPVADYDVIDPADRLAADDIPF